MSNQIGTTWGGKMHFNPKRIGSLMFRTTWIAVMVCGLFAIPVGRLRAESKPDPYQADTSEATKQSVIQSLPLKKLDAKSREKVQNIVSNVTMFRRLPVQVIDCDPDLYLFLVRHPDVVVNTWQALKISQLQLEQTGPDQFRMKETSGTTAELEYLYKSHDLHILYAEGNYEGPILKRTVKGHALFILKTGYVRETDNRYYVTSRLDALLSVDPGAVELVARSIQPILGKIADNNFNQTVYFVGSLSRTIELNNPGVQRLAMQLRNVQPEVRDDFAQLADTISHKPTAVALRKFVTTGETAERPARTTDTKRR